MSKIRETGIGYTYHVSTRCVDQKYLLHKSELKELAIEVIEKAKKTYKFYCFCFTIMDNHIHMIIQTPKKDNISKIMQVINQTIAIKCNRFLNRTGHFWGARFHSTLITSEEQLINTLIYLNLNPVKAGLVYDPKDWIWSSYNTYVDDNSQDSITDLHPFFTESNSIQACQEYYTNLVLETRKKIIIDFLAKHDYIKEDTIICSEKQIAKLLKLYQKIQYKTHYSSISKQRTPKEFL